MMEREPPIDPVILDEDSIMACMEGMAGDYDGMQLTRVIRSIRADERERIIEALKNHCCDVKHDGHPQDELRGYCGYELDHGFDIQTVLDLINSPNEPDMEQERSPSSSGSLPGSPSYPGETMTIRKDSTPATLATNATTITYTPDEKNEKCWRCRVGENPKFHVHELDSMRAYTFYIENPPLAGTNVRNSGGNQ